MKKIDERDTMFARMNYKKGSPQYEDYYKRNPDKKVIDDAIRERPELSGEGTAMYNPINSPIAVANFKFLSDIKNLAEGEPNPKKTEVDQEVMTRRIKGLAKHYGAVLVGITKMKDYHTYSHRGRHEEVYGEKVDLKHPYGIVFAVEMDKEMLNRAPQIAEIVETSKAYVDAGIIGMQLSYYIRELGYHARNHMDANYLVVAPLVARDGGIGDIGRNGILITEDYGSRVRLGVVTTDIPLIADERKEFGLKEFCMRCNKCVRTCPGKAISPGDPEVIHGMKRWRINQENCYNIWRSLGTDCGICITSCPFSQELDKKDIERIEKGDNEIDTILKKHDEKHGIRPYIKELPQWLR